MKFFPETIKNVEKPVKLAILLLEIFFVLVFLIKLCVEAEHFTNKIVFLIVCLIVDMALLCAWKPLQSRPLLQSFVVVIKQISLVLTSYLLLFENITKSQSFFLGLYLLYLNSTHSSSNPNHKILDLIKFSFTLLCFSFEELGNNDSIIILFINVSLCIFGLLGVIFSLMSSNKHANSLFPGFIFNKIYPGCNLVVKKLEQPHNHENIFNKNQLRLEFANLAAQNDFGVSTFDELQAFCRTLKEMHHSTGDGSEISHIFEEQNPLLDLFTIFNQTNYFQMKEPRIYFCFCPKKKVHLRILVISFLYESERFLFLNIEKSHSFQEIKSLREISHRKDQLLASVSHDLRSPLSGILTFVNQAKMVEDPLERNKFLDYSRINADLLMSLINDLLDYSAINKGNINLSISDISLNQVVKEVFDLMRIQSDMKGLFLKVSNDFQENDLTLQTDCRRIKQILINLLNNSIKFTMKGGVELRILKTTLKDVIKFEVIDTGVGIRPEIIQTLGNEYATYDTEQGLNKYGIGLGLNICKKLIKLLGPYDDLFISSIYGKGTKIGFLISQKIQEQASLSLRTIMTYSPRKKKYFGNKMGSLPVEMGNSMNVIPVLRRHSDKSQIMSHKLMSLRFEIKNEGQDGIEEFQVIHSKKHSSLSVKSPIEVLSASMKKKVTLSDFNIKMETRRSLLRGESLNFHNFGEAPKKVEVHSFDNKMKKEDVMNLFSPFESFVVDPDESNYFNEGDLKINLKWFEEDFHGNPSPSNKNPKIKVLIVDDNPFNLLILQSFFKKLKGKYEFKVSSAANGMDAIEQFKESNGAESNDPYQFIFMDCVMPIKDGYAAALEIKELIKKNIEFYDVIIIAVTGMTGVEEEKKCLMFGMDDFLTKPVQERDLQDILSFYINKFDIK